MTESESATAKDATSFVTAAHAEMKAALPFGDVADFEDAARGFLGTIPDARIVADDGRVLWDMAAFEFLRAERAADTVNPSLWRQAQLNLHHGLFEVVPGVYQVRGLDIANMTLIEGDRGVIVVDCLTTIEAATAAIELYRKHRGPRPVTGVLITHSHSDHWGGALAFVKVEGGDSSIPVVTPEFFFENCVSETVIAGPAMLRRALYQFGIPLEKSALGHVDCGLGKSLGLGSRALVRPTDEVRSTGDKRVIDGVEFEFQMAPNTEAPAEFHFFVPKYKLLNLAENCTHVFHNLLPFRGTLVRDATAWSKYIAEALHLWGDRVEAMCGQHHWPIWGTERISKMLRQQRDLYKFAHDQTLRLMNHGLNAGEIAEHIKLPATLEQSWHARGYYGHIKHNVKAIYQRYLGWYDANPTNLDPLPRVAAGKKYVEYMGGAEVLLKRARADFDKGEYRFVAEVASHLVYSDPHNAAARHLLADTYEQLGYLAESATWRSSYLLGAAELRSEISQVTRGHLGRDTLVLLATQELFDLIAVRLNGPRAEKAKSFRIDWRFTDTGEVFRMNLENCALTYMQVEGRDGSDAEYSLARSTLDRLLAKELTFDDALAGNDVEARGDLHLFSLLMSLLDEFPVNFEVVEPLRRWPD
jgi:alkyl sulfatase BDS1-like metallo-beta-lactamase superfamily hydrolase